MPKYQYNGSGLRTFAALGITVKSGDSFEGPEGLKAPGLSLASSEKTAPAVQPTAPKEAPKEQKQEQVKPSAPSDQNAGA